MTPLAEAVLCALGTGLFLLVIRLRPSPVSPRAAFFLAAFLSFLALAHMLLDLHPLAALPVAAGMAPVDGPRALLS
ncbi:MAG TPA: hypothetical protein VIC59_08335 [Gemmatimonadota bacterium]|jgi:hypothetical protein